MIYIYDLILYRPLFNALIFFYNTIAFNDLGLAIIFITVLIRLILFPIFHKSARHQVIMQRLQPELKKLQDAHRNDREKQTKAMMDLYKEHDVNPFAGFLLILVQLPILIALYQIVLRSLEPGFLVGLYGFISPPSSIKTSFLGLINLGESSILIVVLAALAQYLQAKLSLPGAKEGEKLTGAERMSRQMVFLGPLLTIAIFYKFPAAISLYWLTASIFSIFQQIIVNRQTSDNGKLGTISQKNN